MFASVQVFTFKAGLLARLAHDLRLRVQRFEIALERGRVNAWFDADSLLVEGVMKADALNSATLSDSDKQRIQATIRDEVLHVARYPRVEFSGHVQAAGSIPQVTGRLRLHGQEQALQFAVQCRERTLRATVELIPSHFGIEPYKALGGAIRLQDRVLLDIEVRDAEPGALLETSERVCLGPAESP